MCLISTTEMSQKLRGQTDVNKSFFSKKFTSKHYIQDYMEGKEVIGLMIKAMATTILRSV